jgi:hypothetical protein
MRTPRRSNIQGVRISFPGRLLGRLGYRFRRLWLLRRPLGKLDWDWLRIRQRTGRQAVHAILGGCAIQHTLSPCAVGRP